MSSYPGDVAALAPRAAMDASEPLAQPAPEHTRIVLSPLLAAAGIRHGFSTRLGGVSQAYLKQNARAASEAQGGELNLGFTASDTREHVLQNRTRLLYDVFGRELPLVTLRQVHSTTIHPAAREDAGEEATLSGDGLLTDQAGVVLGVQTADCVPVLVADPQTGVVAAFHAGWRGTLGRIVEGGVARMVGDFGVKSENLLAAIGPAIGPCCYGIGAEVEQQFRAGFRYADELLRPPAARACLTEPSGSEQTGPTAHLDLPEANRRQLLNAGLRAEAVDLLPWCTRCRNDLFFSYRAEQGSTGRMLSIIART